MPQIPAPMDKFVFHRFWQQKKNTRENSTPTLVNSQNCIRKTLFSTREKKVGVPSRRDRDRSKKKRNSGHERRLFAHKRTQLWWKYLAILKKNLNV